MTGSIYEDMDIARMHSLDLIERGLYPMTLKRTLIGKGVRAYSQDT